MAAISQITEMFFCYHLLKEARFLFQPCAYAQASGNIYLFVVPLMNSFKPVGNLNQT